MNAVKNALTRKFGPLPAWTWAIVLGVATYFFRNRAGAGGAGAGAGDGSLPYVGPYGQDYYPLPGGAGVTGGGSGGSDGSGGGSGGGSGDGGNPSSNPPVINVNVPGQSAQPGSGTHNKRHPKPKKPKGAPKGSEHTGPHKPGKGWRGIGGGWWAPPKHKKPRSGAGKAATGRNRGSVTTGSDRVGKTRPSGGAGLTHSGRRTAAPKAGTARRKR